MTTAQAKKLLRAELERQGVPFTKLSAKTISFQDLARDERIFVKIHGYRPGEYWDDLRSFAHAHGFCLDQPVLG